ncbi:MAG: glycosyltransferase [bacterium]|nr:glycosyltransferase [bacterium]
MNQEPDSPAAESPTVSVLMSVFRPDPAQFRRALVSILEQEFRDLELIVVEDPSEVDVAPVLAERPDPRIRHVKNPRPVALAASRNQALALARSEFVAIADADDICLPHRVGDQVAFLRAHPQVSLCGGQIEVIDDTGRSLGYRHYPCDPKTLATTLRRYNAIAHPTVLARRAALTAVAGYDVDAGSGEDYDLWSRLVVAGHALANLDRVVLQYRVHEGSTKATRLRATLDATLRVKRTYWRAQMGFGDRARMLGERALRLLPAGVVQWLFLRRHLRRLPPSEAARG